MKFSKILILVFASSLFLSSQGGFWQEVPYRKTFSLKGGALAAGKGNDLWAAAKKSDGKDLFLVKWDEVKHDWVQKSEKPIRHLTASSDGAVFVAREERDGEKDFWHIVRFFDGKEKDIGTWPTKVGPYEVRGLGVINLAARNKNDLWCTFEEVGPKSAFETEDGYIMTSGPLMQHRFTEQWNGSSWKKREDDRLVIKVTTPMVSVAKDGSVYGKYESSWVEWEHRLPRKNFVRLKEDHWEGVPIRWWIQKIEETFAGGYAIEGKIISFSATDANNIWLIVGEGSVFKWNGKKLEPKGGKQNFYTIVSVSDDLVFVLGDDGKLYKWVEGEAPVQERPEVVESEEESVSFWQKVINWFKSFF